MAPSLRAQPSTTAVISTKRRLLFGAALFCGLCGFMYLPDDILLSLWKDKARSLQAVKRPDNVTTYDQKHIMDTATYFPHFVPRLLVFDGDRRFEVFGLAHKDGNYYKEMRYSFRDSGVVPLLVRSLKENFPERFRPGKPVFQILFSENDSTDSPCVNDRDSCPVDSFAPFLLFGTTPRDHSIFPTLKAFPFAYFTTCLYDFKVHGQDTCHWKEHVDRGLAWETLVSTIAWRGSDFAFMSHNKDFELHGSWNLNNRLRLLDLKNATRDETLKDLTISPYYNTFGPRWRAVLQSVIATDEAVDGTPPWIDARFAGGTGVEVRDKLMHKGIHVNGKRISSFKMSKYKYQIDLGGGGGTTWGGTISKLMMPGVLFHHETVNMDWFYDIMIPWEHYVPVRWDLSDLHENFKIAERNPELMKKIAGQATKLAEYLMSKEYMEIVYKELFVDYLGKVVSSYKPTGSWEEMKETYRANGYEMFSVAVCNNDSKCILQGKENNFYDQDIINVAMVPSDNGVFESKHIQESAAIAEK